MKMILLKLFSLLLIHKAESAGCLLKPGFGLDKGYKLVNYWKSSLPINLGECQAQCDSTVREFCKNCTHIINLLTLFNSSMTVLSLYQSLITAPCTNLPQSNWQRRKEQMQEYVLKLTKTEHGYGGDLSQFTCLTLSQEHSYGVEKN